MTKYRLTMYGVRGRKFVDSVLDEVPTHDDLADLADKDGWGILGHEIMPKWWRERLAHVTPTSERTGKPLYNLRSMLGSANWDNKQGSIRISYRIVEIK